MTLRGDDVRPDAASRLMLTAAMAPGASLDVDLDLDLDLDFDLEFDLDLDLALPEDDTEVHASTLRTIAIRGAGVRLAPILAWLRAREAPALDLAEAELGLDVGVTLAPVVGGSGKVTIARARFAAVNKAGERILGAPVDLALGVKATVSADRGSRARSISPSAPRTRAGPSTGSSSSPRRRAGGPASRCAGRSRRRSRRTASAAISRGESRSISMTRASARRAWRSPRACGSASTSRGA